MRKLLKKTPIVAALALAGAGSAVTAQPMLEEVIVTAQKRAQSLQDVPISVTALQGEKIKDAGIPDMTALADFVPNLHIAKASVNTNIYMRGVGSGNNAGFEQSVGMYIDGVYMGRGYQYRNGFLDIERVEVLRGPQGTLFGRNTVAGAMNVTTASPDIGGDTTGEIAVFAESNGGMGGEGFIESSFTDTFAARVAYRYNETEGYVSNTFLGEDEPELESESYRITLAWEPTDNLATTFKYSHSDAERVGAPSATWLFLSPEQRAEQVPNASAFADIAYNLMDANFPDFGNIAGQDFTTFRDNGYGQSAEDGLGIGKNPDGDDAEVDNFVLNVDWSVGDYTITGITGWSEYEFVANIDADWLPLQFIARDDDETFDQFSQELRIASPGGEFFDFVAGLYYDESSLAIDRRVTFDINMDGLVPDLLGVESLLTLLTGGAYGPNQIGRNHVYELDTTSYAAFFQGTFNITDYLRVTLGVRYTEEEKDVVSTQFLSDSDTGMGVASDNFFLAQVQATNFNTYAYNYSDDRKTDDLIPSINVQWDVGDDSMLYVSFSQGFKSGGFTAADDGEPGDLIAGSFPCENVGGRVNIEDCYDPTNPNEDFEFEDESVDAYEIGGKHTLLGGAMTLNWAAFYTEYDNLQTSIFQGISFGVTNASAAEITGIEVDARWAATENLMIGGNVAWLDAEYSDFTDAPCTAIQLDFDPACGTPQGFTNNDLTGEPTNYASDYSASLFWDYIIPLDSMEMFISGDINYRDEFNSSGDNDPNDVIDAYTKVNLRMGIRGDQWEVMAYGRNIFDEAALQQSFDTPVLAGSHSYFMDEGEVFGLRGKYSF
jgi:outer membrane receptor protein involved in Fe transport